MSYRKSVLDKRTQENLDRTIKEVVAAVADGTLTKEQATGGLQYLVKSVDNGAEAEIETWTQGVAAYKRSY